MIHPITIEDIIDVRDIVGRGYDERMGGKPERFDPKRPLFLSTIPGSYEHASYVMIVINGSPIRGGVIVSLQGVSYEGSRNLCTGKPLSVEECRTIVQFTIAVTGALSSYLIPPGFNWNSSHIEWDGTRDMRWMERYMNNCRDAQSRSIHLSQSCLQNETTVADLAHP